MTLLTSAVDEFMQLLGARSPHRFLMCLKYEYELWQMVTDMEFFHCLHFSVVLGPWICVRALGQVSSELWPAKL